MGVARVVVVGRNGGRFRGGRVVGVIVSVSVEHVADVGEIGVMVLRLSTVVRVRDDAFDAAPESQEDREDECKGGDGPAHGSLVAEEQGAARGPASTRADGGRKVSDTFSPG